MEYKFIQTDPTPENIKLYSDLLSKVFPETKKYTPAFLNWQYNLNPHGKVIGYDAFIGNQLAAHYVTIPVLYTYQGKEFKGLLSLNTATHPNHQGKKLFTQLAEKTYELGANESYQFVIGVANQNSTHGFISKLGFKLISPLEVKIYLGKTDNVTVSPNHFTSQWDEKSTAWRTSNPSANYFKNKHHLVCDTHISLIKAILNQKNIPDVPRLENKSGVFKMLIGLNNKVGKTALAISLPDKMKPSPLNLILKPLSNFNLQLDKSNIYFELIDFDAY